MITTYDQLKELREKVTYYTLGMVNLPEHLMQMSSQTKLVLLQRTPARAIKHRIVGGFKIPYVKIGYIERCLNFVSNFDRHGEILNQGYKEVLETRNVKDKVTGQQVDKDYYTMHAWVAMKYKINIDGKYITHCTYGTRQMAKNPAICDYTVFEACRSQATKSFADILGIASDKVSAENKAVQEAREKLEKENASGIFEANVKADFGGVPPTKEDKDDDDKFEDDEFNEAQELEDYNNLIK